MSVDPKALTNLADLLESRQNDIAQANVVAGFDGFVDELIQVVDERQNLNSFTAVKSLNDFGAMLQAAAGRSSLREIVVNSTDAGGCAVNLGDGIVTLGVQLDYFGTLGTPRHRAFDEFAQKCRACIGWGTEPGKTLALEFADGKYMLSAVTQLADFKPSLLDEVWADGVFTKACQQADLLAITNWTLYPHMTECWAKFQKDILSQISQRPHLFIDLVDPRTRSKEDILAMIEVLKGFEDSCQVTFGGNLNEANVFADLLGIDRVEEEGPAVAEQAGAIREKLGVSQVATHCLQGAGCADATGVHWGYGPYTPTPKKSTGAGDRFNAGFCLGLILGLPAADRLLLGGVSSGHFVRNAQSGTAADLASFCRIWANGDLTD